MKTKFKSGDKVKSAPDSSDVMTMKATWVCEIHEVISENNSGGCFETLGYWEPIKDNDGNVSEFWKGQKLDPTKLTLRQLYGSSLIKLGERDAE